MKTEIDTQNDPTIVRSKPCCRFENNEKEGRHLCENQLERRWKCQEFEDNEISGIIEIPIASWSHIWIQVRALVKTLKHSVLMTALSALPATQRSFNSYCEMKNTPSRPVKVLLWYSSLKPRRFLSKKRSDALIFIINFLFYCFLFSLIIEPIKRPVDVGESQKFVIVFMIFLLHFCEVIFWGVF